MITVSLPVRTFFFILFSVVISLISFTVAVDVKAATMPAPTNLAASSCTSNATTLSWTGTPNPDGYYWLNVYSPDGDVVVNANVGGSPSYKVSVTESGTYTWYVAECADGSCSTSAQGPNFTCGSASGSTDTQYDTPIKGYAGATSINKGQSIDLHVSTKSASYRMDVYREGAAEQLVYSVASLPGTNYPMPVADPTIGLIEAKWPTTYTLSTATTWKSGVYRVQLTTKEGSKSNIIFVLRDDASTSDILYEIPVDTYEAYNDWGGQSLYVGANGRTHAYKVSFDRPYTGDGMGSFNSGDAQMIKFLESKGYNLSYNTSVDLHAHPELLAKHKVFLSNYHDEYWSLQMRDALAAARDRGMNIAFFAANDIYWQIRFEPSTSGSPNRIIVGYKDAPDPLATTNPQIATVRWRDAPVNRPENELLGNMYEGNVGSPVLPWVVSNAGYWVYNGTGLSDNSKIAGLVSGEWDAAVNNGLSPVGLITLSQSPAPATESPSIAIQNGTIYRTWRGAWVFSAGTLGWAYNGTQSPLLTDTRVQKMTTNILDAMIGKAGSSTTADQQRKSNLVTIQQALQKYYAAHGTYLVAGSGYGGQGDGWASYEDGSSYKLSVTHALYNAGYLSTPTLDDPTHKPGYMLYLCDNNQSYALYATLDSASVANLSNAEASCNGYGSNGAVTAYGKNYALAGSSSDTTRRADLVDLQQALERYYRKHGTYHVAGTGYLNQGQGWLSYTGTSYAKSIEQGLQDDGDLAIKIEDPLGFVGNRGYMLYLCNNDQSYALYATLDYPTSAESSAASAACGGSGVGPGTAYNKNDVVTGP